MTRVLVCGGRRFADRELLYGTLDEIHGETPIEVIIHGAATGADTLAKEWAVARGVPHDPYPADWNNTAVPGAVVQWSKKTGRPYNVLAGFNRNARMLQEGCPTLVIGFPDPDDWRGSPGTNDMLQKARIAKDAGAALEVRSIYAR